jgi:UPF0755 protein
MRTLENKILALILGVSLIALSFFAESDDYSDKKPGREIVVTISNGATGTQIGTQLENSGVIKKSNKFISFYLSNTEARGIAPGSHKVQTHISVKTAVSELLDQKRIVNSINVAEGSTLSDVISQLKKSGHITFVNKSNLTPVLANPKNSIEGQLFPAIYSFEPGTTSDSALSQMLSRFGEEIKTIPLVSTKRVTSYDLLKIASIVQVEADSKDFGKVAQVIYNRLKIGMPLQLNSTVQYAAGLRGRIALSREATMINSPYNTYRVTGLPPTPISNPSTLALKAAMNPVSGDWLYFITVAPGDTRFTKDFKEFSDWNTLYNNNLAKGLFK